MRFWPLAVAFLALVAAVFFSGRYSAQVDCRAADLKRSQHDAQLLRAAYDTQLEQKQHYQAQLERAQRLIDDSYNRLARVRSLRVPHIVCHDAAATAAAGAVPGLPGAPGAGAAGHGIVPANGGEFDPTAAIIAEADRADAVVESCRAFYNKWPVPSLPAIPTG